MQRCGWVGLEPIYVAYHDEEWGVPEYDSRALWEKLILDGFQAGLSWIMILKKRDAFRKAFANFDPEIIATWGPKEVAALLKNSGIVRHRGKIQAVIGNAHAYLELQAEIPFSERIWAYTGGVPLVGSYRSQADVPKNSDLSAQISKDLNKAGFKFCGPTIIYAWMEACGLINNHIISCERFEAVKKFERI